MKHKRIVISVALATIMLVAVCAVCVNPLSVSAATSTTATNTQSGIHFGPASAASAPSAQSGKAIVKAPGLVGSSILGAPAITTEDGIGFDLFVVGTDGALWWKTQGVWTSLGGQITADPAAVSQSAGVMDVFVRGTDGALWSRYTENGGATWTAWFKVGGQLLPGTGPAAYAWGNQRIGVCVIGTDNALWHVWADSAHLPQWESLGGTLTSSPTATSWGTGRIDVFARATDNHPWQITYSGNMWGSWTQISGIIGPAGTGPAATSYQATSSGQTRQAIDLFVIGTDNHLWWNHFDKASLSTTGWSNWANGNLGGTLTSSPSAMNLGGVLNPPSPVTAQVFVFARATDTQPWYIWGYRDSWFSWFNYGA